MYKVIKNGGLKLSLRFNVYLKFASKQRSLKISKVVRVDEEKKE